MHIPIADIPQPVLDDFGARIKDYLVPIFGVVDRERAPKVRLLELKGTDLFSVY